MTARAAAAPPRPIAWFALMALGLAILIVVALLRGDPQDVPWYLAHVLPLMAVMAVAATPWGGRVTTTVLAAYAIGLPALAWLVGFGPFDPWDEPARLQLFTENPNLLGADLVAVFWAAALVRPKGPWMWLLPVVAVAVVLTGSRTALLALAAGIAAWLLIPSTSVRVRTGLVGVGLLVGGFVTFANHQVRQEAAGANLLPQSTTFDDRAWTVYPHSVVEVVPDAAAGPWPGTRADRIVARSGESRLTLYQGFGRSVEDTEYVASVYLRADVPQTVVLSNHLARTPCEVTTEWTRCVTPVGVGNGRSATQFRFEAVESGESFDVFAFGPQYEIGAAPTAYEPRGGTLLPSVVAQRFTAPVATLDTTFVTRTETWRMGWSAATSGSWLGKGVGWAADVEPPRGGLPLAHAHNLGLERLAADGVVGALGWLVVAIAIVGPAFGALGWRAAPWLLALITLNTWDATWFHSGSYFSTAIVVGAAIGRVHSLRHERGRASIPTAHDARTDTRQEAQFS